MEPTIHTKTWKNERDNVGDWQIFRKIYVPKYEKGEWKSRTNREQ